MKFVYSILFFTVLMLAKTAGFAQQGGIIVNDSATTGVIIHADPRLAILAAAIKPKNTGRSGGMIRSGRGFRVQIFNGNDRIKATERKVDFMQRFPGVRTYMTYIQPQFRVKVGNFKTRAEAHKLYQQLNSLYSPVMIVPDIIEINTLKDDQQH